MKSTSEVIARLLALTEAAKIALNWGYTWDFDPKYQPWANEFNFKLRVQNRAIHDKILELLNETYQGDDCTTSGTKAQAGTGQDD